MLEELSTRRMMFLGLFPISFPCSVDHSYTHSKSKQSTSDRVLSTTLYNGKCLQPWTLNQSDIRPTHIEILSFLQMEYFFLFLLNVCLLSLGSVFSCFNGRPPNSDKHFSSELAFFKVLQVMVNNRTHGPLLL